MTRRTRRLLRALASVRRRKDRSAPYVCPGCCAVAEPCASWCPDDAADRSWWEDSDDDHGRASYDDRDDDD